MSNVKPGDMARVITPAIGGGTIVVVMRELDQFEYLFQRYHQPPGIRRLQWVVKVANGSSAHRWNMGQAKLDYLLPGSLAACEDEYLRRIDPEPDVEALPRIVAEGEHA